MKLFKYLAGVVIAVACCSVGSASSRIVNEPGNTIPKNMKIDAAAIREFSQYFPEAQSAIGDQLAWIARKQAEAAKLGCKIGIQARLISKKDWLAEDKPEGGGVGVQSIPASDEEKLEFGFCIFHPNGTIGEGVSTLFSINKLDYSYTLDSIAKFCSDGKIVIDDSLRGLANLAVVMRGYYAGGSKGRFVQLRYDDPQVDSPKGHCMNPVLVPAAESKFLGWDFSAVTPEGIPPLSADDPTLSRRRKMAIDVVHKGRPDFVTGTPIAVTPLEEGDYFIIDDWFHDSEILREDILAGRANRPITYYEKGADIRKPHHRAFPYIKIIDVMFTTHQNAAEAEKDPNQKALLDIYKSDRGWMYSTPIFLTVDNDTYQQAMRVYEDLVDQLAQANPLEFQSSHDRFLVNLAKTNRVRLLNMLRKIRYISVYNNKQGKENAHSCYTINSNTYQKIFYFPVGIRKKSDTLFREAIDRSRKTHVDDRRRYNVEDGIIKYTPITTMSFYGLRSVSMNQYTKSH